MAVEPCKILVIDDEEAILRFLCEMLAAKGYKVDTAENGEDGLIKFHSGSYHLVLTDIKMPGVSGLDVLTEIKQSKEKATPVIGMSGTPWLLDNHLFDAILPKPSPMEDLLKTIGKVLRSFNPDK